MAEKKAKKADDIQKQEAVEAPTKAPQGSMSRMSLVRARIEKQGYATDKDIANLHD